MTMNELDERAVAIADDLERLGKMASPEGNLAMIQLLKGLLRARRAILTGAADMPVPLDSLDVTGVLAVDLDAWALGCDALAGRAMTRGGHGEFWLTLGDILRAELNRRRCLVLETLEG